MLPHLHLIAADKHTRLRLALEHFVDPMVGTNVRFQVRLADNTMITKVTLERLETSVNFVVTFEIRVGLERRRAVGVSAHERRVSCMSPEVDSEL